MTITIDQLEEIMRTEIELAQELLVVLEEQQEAIVHLKISSLDDLIAREHQLLKPIQDLEKERNKIVCHLIPESVQKTEPVVPLRELVVYLNTEDAKRISALGATLGEKVETIVNFNRRLKILLNQSLRFVRESVGILTDNYSKQLIDQKI
ncbi:MAG: flagellar protein FlgN [Ignavibacteriales bacterium]|nr:flagellar protein FlgN [Ignavibacteriales bacterium]